MAYITKKYFIPKSIKKKLLQAQRIKKRLLRQKTTHYKFLIQQNYAAHLVESAIEEFILSKFGTKDEPILSYAHLIEANLKDGIFILIRNGTREPDIFEKLNLNINL
jgi:hypothetical protein